MLHHLLSSFPAIAPMRLRSFVQSALPSSAQFTFGLLGGAIALSTVGGGDAMAQPLQGRIAQQIAQADTTASGPAPTVRYARGEDIDLAEIVAEWRGYYDDVPVYLCVCQDGSCNQTQQWPYRVFDRYQLSVALGPNNGKVAEEAGSNCFDIADGSRPTAPRAFVIEPAIEPDTTQAQTPASPPATPPARPSVPRRPAPPVPPAASDPVVAPVSPTVRPPSPSLPPAQSVAASGVPTATTINNGADIRLDWPSGSSNVVNVAGSTWNVNVLDALDCPTLTVVEQKVMEARRVVGTPAVDETTGNVAVPVLLDTCVESDQTAVFILDPTEGGGYALYRTQLPGARAFPNEFSTYAFSTIVDMRYWEGDLLVRHGSASDAEAIMIFRPDGTPAGDYAGCAIVADVEGANALCNNS